MHKRELSTARAPHRSKLPSFERGTNIHKEPVLHPYPTSQGGVPPPFLLISLSLSFPGEETKLNSRRQAHHGPLNMDQVAGLRRTLDVSPAQSQNVRQDGSFAPSGLFLSSTCCLSSEGPGLSSSQGI